MPEDDVMLIFILHGLESHFVFSVNQRPITVSYNTASHSVVHQASALIPTTSINLPIVRLTTPE